MLLLETVLGGLLLMVIFRLAARKVLSLRAFLTRRRLPLGGRRFPWLLVPILTTTSQMTVVLLQHLRIVSLGAVLGGMTTIEDKIVEVPSTADTINLLVLVGRRA